MLCGHPAAQTGKQAAKANTAGYPVASQWGSWEPRPALTNSRLKFLTIRPPGPWQPLTPRPSAADLPWPQPLHARSTAAPRYPGSFQFPFLRVPFFPTQLLASPPLPLSFLPLPPAPRPPLLQVLGSLQLGPARSSHPAYSACRRRLPPGVRSTLSARQRHAPRLGCDLPPAPTG